ncbi:hypothetical protein D3C76_1755620 [compost metagenome]
MDITTRVYTTPKTKGSEGYVPFPTNIKEILERIKKESAEKIYGFNNSMLVFGGRPHTIIPTFTGISKGIS